MAAFWQRVCRKTAQFFGFPPVKAARKIAFWRAARQDCVNSTIVLEFKFKPSNRANYKWICKNVRRLALSAVLTARSYRVLPNELINPFIYRQV